MKQNHKIAIVKAIQQIYVQDVVNGTVKDLSSLRPDFSQSAATSKDTVAEAQDTVEQTLTKEKRNNWNTAEIKKIISEFSDQGKLSDELIELICRSDGECAPVEFECLDFKEGIQNTAYEKAKLVKRIVSFYNTYGGYLVFGVAETEAETRFEVVGMTNTLDVESIKASIKEFTGERVQITPMNFNVLGSNGEQLPVTFLHVPKRPLSHPPLHFSKNGTCNDQ
ncbi:ATP-binding protein, partial [Undibacterium sp.]|uniref:AlbA family DNA-binding domain-containing protein n=1 Tax=Undibacterium sp. TaxID=1914977 RepID=UPI002C05BE8F